MSEIKRLVGSYAPTVRMSEVFYLDSGELYFHPIIGITVWEITDRHHESFSQYAEINYITAEAEGLTEHVGDNINQLGIAAGDSQHELSYWATNIAEYVAKLKERQKA